MASLQDQLLKAGLSDRNKANKIRKDKIKQTKAARRSKQQVNDALKQGTKPSKTKQAERDLALNLELQRQAQQKAITAQIIQLIKANKLDRQQGEISFSFIHNKAIKRIYVTAEIKTRLSSGYLSIVGDHNKKIMEYEIVPTTVAKKIAKRDPQWVILIDQGKDNEIQDGDPYTDFKIPDDLVW